MNAKMRTGVRKMLISVIPAHVLRNATDGVEFMARAVTSAMESQAEEDMPKREASQNGGREASTITVKSDKGERVDGMEMIDTCCSTVENMGESNGTVREEERYGNLGRETGRVVRVALDCRLDSELDPVLAFVYRIECKKVFLGINPCGPINIG